VFRFGGMDRDVREHPRNLLCVTPAEEHRLDRPMLRRAGDSSGEGTTMTEGASSDVRERYVKYRTQLSGVLVNVLPPP